MLLDTTTENPYQGYRNNSENQEQANTAVRNNAGDATIITIQVENPPADASSLQYGLVEVVENKPVV